MASPDPVLPVLVKLIAPPLMRLEDVFPLCVTERAFEVVVLAIARPVGLLVVSFWTIFSPIELPPFGTVILSPVVFTKLVQLEPLYISYLPVVVLSLSIPA